MSMDKHTSIFLCQMKAIVYTFALYCAGAKKKTVTERAQDLNNVHILNLKVTLS